MAILENDIKILDNQKAILENDIKILDNQKVEKLKELDKLRERNRRYQEYNETRSKDATYINVPFEQKDTAKRLGAMWNSHKRCWFVPTNLDMEPFLKLWKLNYLSTAKMPIQVRPSNMSEKEYIVKTTTAQFSIKELKAILKERGISTDGMTEREELEEALSIDRLNNYALRKQTSYSVEAR